MTVDERYEKLVKERGLYGKAFFGHRATKKESKLLRSLYAKAQREEQERKEFLDNLGKDTKAEE